MVIRLPRRSEAAWARVRARIEPTIADELRDGAPIDARVLEEVVRFFDARVCGGAPMPAGGPVYEAPQRGASALDLEGLVRKAVEVNELILSKLDASDRAMQGLLAHEFNPPEGKPE